MFFELQPIMIFSPVANFGHHPLHKLVHLSIPNIKSEDGLGISIKYKFYEKSQNRHLWMYI